MSYIVLEKDGKKYKTTSILYARIAKMEGYKQIRVHHSSFWNVLNDIPLLPFRIPNKEREKYRVMLRLMG